MGKIKKTITIKWHPKTSQLCQIPKEGLEYAFVSEDFQQIHQLVWCKDFLQDAVYGQLHQKKVEIYGFTYDPETMPPVYMEKTRLMITSWKDHDFQRRLLDQCLPLLHAVEKKLKMTKTQIFACKSIPPRYRKSGVFILESSRRWMKSPPLISLFTYLIRIGMVHNPKRTPLQTLTAIKKGDLVGYFGGSENKGADDKNIAEGADKAIRMILKHGDRKIFHRDWKKNYPLVALTSSIHNTYGIRGFGVGHTRVTFPYWHRLEK